MINHIVIVGGGTAGWITASTLIEKLKNVQITLVESKEVPIVGVGESTTGKTTCILEDHKHLPSLEYFMKNTGATYKYGIKHVDWSNINDEFYSPIGANIEINNIPEKNYDAYRIYHIAKNIKYSNPLTSSLMKNNKLAFFRENGKVFKYDTTSAAFHIDAYKTSAFLKEFCLKTKKIKRIEDTITNIKKNDFGFVTELFLKSGNSIKGDFFIDCSGWSKTIIKTMDTKFISFSENIITNRALLFPKITDTNKIIKNYTKATARKFGWTFEIPLQNRIGRGYIFNKEMLSDTDAENEIISIYGKDTEFTKTFSFETGRVNKFWVNNVLSVGLSSNFIEPLESTGIHTTIRQIDLFLASFFTKNIDLNNNHLIDTYNNYISNLIDTTKDFITYHYQSSRKDTNFWIEASSPKRWSYELEKKIKTWKSRMPRDIDYLHNGYTNEIDNSLWLQLGMGYNLFNSEIAKKELKYFQLNNNLEKKYEEVEKSCNFLTNKALTTNEFYSLL